MAHRAARQWRRSPLWAPPGPQHFTRFGGRHDDVSYDHDDGRSGSNCSASVSGTALPRAGWSATTNAPSSTADTPAHALDGNFNTRFSTNEDQAPGLAIRVDLGSARAFDQLAMRAPSSPNDYARGYDVLVSANNSSWATVATCTGTGQPRGRQFPHPNGTVREGGADRSERHQLVVDRRVRPLQQRSGPDHDDASRSNSRLYAPSPPPLPPSPHPPTPFSQPDPAPAPTPRPLHHSPSSPRLPTHSPTTPHPTPPPPPPPPPPQLPPPPTLPSTYSSAPPRPRRAPASSHDHHHVTFFFG